MPERWTCIFADRIVENNIFLTSPQQYGSLYFNPDRTPDKDTKERKSIPKELLSVFGGSYENKPIIIAAIAKVLNPEIGKSKGLVIRDHSARTALPGLQAAIIKLQGKALRIKNTTNWVVYISADDKFYWLDGRCIESEFSPEQYQKLRRYEEIIEKW